jgi:hypothetical protein
MRTRRKVRRFRPPARRRSTIRGSGNAGTTLHTRRLGRTDIYGMLDTARLLGLSLLAYSAQRQGILTGKYHADRSLIQGVTPLRRKSWV